MSVELKNDERLDDLHRKGYKIIQSPKKFCFGVDAVLLAGFADIKPTDHVLDIGTGTGIIPILLEGRDKGEHFDAIDVQYESIDMATRSVSFNHLEDKIKLHCINIKEATELFPLSSFDAVVTNPPYMAGSSGINNPGSAKAIARFELEASLDEWIEASSRLVKVSGKLFMIHRPHRLTDIMATLDKYQMTVKRIRMVHPYVHKEANMVLIEAVRQGKSQVIVEPPLIIYQDKNVYTDEIYDIYGYDKKAMVEGKQ